MNGGDWGDHDPVRVDPSVAADAVTAARAREITLEQADVNMRLTHAEFLRRFATRCVDEGKHEAASALLLAAADIEAGRAG